MHSRFFQGVSKLKEEIIQANLLIRNRPDFKASYTLKVF